MSSRVINRAESDLIAKRYDRAIATGGVKAVIKFINKLDISGQNQVRVLLVKVLATKMVTLVRVLLDKITKHSPQLYCTDKDEDNRHMTDPLRVAMRQECTEVDLGLITFLRYTGHNHQDGAMASFVEAAILEDKQARFYDAITASNKIDCKYFLRISIDKGARVYTEKLLNHFNECHGHLPASTLFEDIEIRTIAKAVKTCSNIEQLLSFGKSPSSPLTHILEMLDDTGDDTDTEIIAFVCRLIKAGAFEHEMCTDDSLSICKYRGFNYLFRLITRAIDIYG